MEYREAEAKDLKGILGLYPQLSPENADCPPGRARETWDEIMGNPRYGYFVAVDGERIVSTCNITLVPNLTHGCRPYAVIENVVTDGAYRNKGIGRKVMEMAIAFAKKAGCYKVMLLSGAHRTGAHGFYESLGFSGDSKKGFIYKME